MSEDSKYSYMRSQEIFGAKKGDRVYIFRKAYNHEAGWANTWNPNMDLAVGKEGEVISRNHGSGGILINVDGIFDYFYPYFVLRLK